MIYCTLLVSIIKNISCLKFLLFVKYQIKGMNQGKYKYSRAPEDEKVAFFVDNQVRNQKQQEMVL